MRVGSSLICRFIRATSSCHRPRQIALAVVLGILLGALPKSSLMFILAAMICYIIPSHWIVLISVALCVTAVHPMLESAFGQVGLWSLTSVRLSGLWLRIDRMPVVPWLGLHNTLVHGGLLLWAIVSLPTYVIAKAVAKYFFAASELDHMLDQVTVNRRTVEQSNEVAKFQELRPHSGCQDPGKLVVMDPPTVVFETTQEDPPVVHTQTLAAQLNSTETTTSTSVAGIAMPNLSFDEQPATADEIVQRAASLAAWADDAITSLLQMDQVTANDTAKPESSVPSALNGTDDDDEKWLIETTMEVVRIAEQTVSQQASLKSKSTQSMSTTASPMDSVALKSNMVLRRDPTAHADQHIHLDAAGVGDTPLGNSTVPQNRSDQPREEALRYLLRHLKAIQEKVKTQ
jgi:uncharacterized protein (TIGR03546 family)